MSWLSHIQSQQYKRVAPYMTSSANMVKLILFTALFSLVFINSYKPFNSEHWAEMSPWSFFIASFFVVLLGIVVLALSRYLMYRIVRYYPMRYFEYVIWVLLELTVLAGFYTLVALLFSDELSFWCWSDVVTVFKEVNFSTFMIVLLPYAFSWMYFSYSEKRARLQELEDGILFRRRHATFHFRDEKGDIRFTVATDNLIYIEAADNYIEINYLNNGVVCKELLRNSLKRVCDNMEETPVRRCHRSYMVNYDHVVALRKTSEEIGLELDIPEVKRIPVSKSYADDATMAFMQYSSVKE